MAKSVAHFFDADRLVSATGTADSGLVYFYYTETTNLAPIYADKNLITPLTNPVPIAAGQIFPEIFLDPSIVYRRRIIHNSDGSVFDRDPLSSVNAASSSVNFKDYHPGDATDATVAWDEMIADITASGIRKVFVPAGIYKLVNANWALDDLEVSGSGEATVFSVGANNSNLWNVTGANGVLNSCQLLGDGTSSATSNGVAVILSGANFHASEVFVNNMGQGVIYGTTAVNTRGPTFERIKSRSCGAGSSGFPVLVFMNGSWERSIYRDFDVVTSALFYGVLYGESGSAFWKDLQIIGGHWEGFLRYAVSCTDETYDGTDRCYGVDIQGGYYKNCIQGAIKLKQAKDYRISKVLTEGCGNSPENAAGGLRGSIILHGMGRMEASDCIVKNSGSSGVQVTVPYTVLKLRPDGFGMPSVLISNCIIEGTGLTAPSFGAGISALGPCKDITIQGCSVRGAVWHGIHVECGAGLHQTQFLSISGCHVLDSPNSTGIGIMVNRVWEYFDSNNKVFNVRGICNWVENVENWVNQGGRSGDSYTATACFDVSNVKYISFNGSASCFDYSTAWSSGAAVSVGTRFYTSAGRVYEVIVAGNLGASAPTAETGAVVNGTATLSFVHMRRQNAPGIYFRTGGTITCAIGNEARFENAPGWFSGTAPSLLTRGAYYKSSNTLVGTGVPATFSLAWPEPNTDYRVSIEPTVNETFYVLNKTTSSFQVQSSNATSTAVVNVSVSR